MAKNKLTIKCAGCEDKIEEDAVVECCVCMKNFCELCCNDYDTVVGLINLCAECREVMA